VNTLVQPSILFLFLNVFSLHKVPTFVAFAGTLSSRGVSNINLRGADFGGATGMSRLRGLERLDDSQLEQSGLCLGVLPRARGTVIKRSSQNHKGQQQPINLPLAIRLLHLGHINRFSACNCCASCGDTGDIAWLRHLPNYIGIWDVPASAHHPSFLPMDF